MVIEWTPWNVPMHRRLEVLSVAFVLFSAHFIGPLSIGIMMWLMVILSYFFPFYV